MIECSEKSLRIDKWMKIACIFKTRNQAAEACNQGKVKINNQSVKASRLIKIGDTIEIKFKWRTRTFDVLNIVTKSIKAADARLLYHEHEPTCEEKAADELRSLFYQSSRLNRPKYKGRPTKKERRELDKFRNKEQF